MTSLSGSLALGLLSSVLLAGPAEPDPKTPPEPSPAKIREWITQLDSPEFTQRTRAQAQLQALDMSALPTLRQALRTTPSPEVRRRLQQVMAGIEQAHLARITRQGKQALALLQVSNSRIARFGGGAIRRIDSKAHVPAVCVHPSGLFLTTATSVRNLRNDSAPLVLHPGTEAQKQVRVRVARIDTRLDLALLQAEEKLEATALPLGEAEGISELAEVIPLVFPNPSRWLAGKFPAPGIQRGLITSLYLSDGEVHRLQFKVEDRSDELVGPLLDAKGKLIGLASGVAPNTSSRFGGGRFGGRTSASAADLVIPLSHLRRFLAQPLVRFPLINELNQHEPATFEVQVGHIVPSEKPLEVELILAFQGKERKIQMKPERGVYRARVVPVPENKEKPKVQVVLSYGDGTMQGQLANLTFKIADQAVKLRHIRTIRFGEKAKVTLIDGQTLTGALSGPEEVELDLGGIKLQVSLKDATQLRIVQRNVVAQVPCTIVARVDTKEVARLEDHLAILSSPAFLDAALTAGKWEEVLRMVARLEKANLADTHARACATWAHAALKQYPEACRAHEQVLKQDPDNLELLGNQAPLLLLAGRSAEYRKRCAKLLQQKVETSDHRGAYLIARICTLRTREVPEHDRLASLSKQMLQDPGDQQAWYLHAAGMVHYRRGEYEKALAQFHNSINKEPSWDANVCNHLGLALTYHQLGQNEEARKWLQRATEWFDKTAPTLRRERGNAFPIHTHDWLAGQLLLQEARSAILKTKKP
jgi:tetratricopeptide (TPR) repeat protein/S1-C subfamily serine protease